MIDLQLKMSPALDVALEFEFNCLSKNSLATIQGWNQKAE